MSEGKPQSPPPVPLNQDKPVVNPPATPINQDMTKGISMSKPVSPVNVFVTNAKGDKPNPPANRSITESKKK